MHKKYTFVPGSLGRFIKKHGIIFSYLQVPAIMICRKEMPGERYFLLTLYKRSGGVFKIPFSQGPAVKKWPKLEEVLEMLTSDVILSRNNPTPEELAQECAFEEEDWDQEFDRLKSVTEAFEGFLGKKAVEELIDMAQQGFEMEGDGGWRRQRTCG